MFNVFIVRSVLSLVMKCQMKKAVCLYVYRGEREREDLLKSEGMTV